MADPKAGEMLLHDYIQPPLEAGRYRLDVSSGVTIDGLGLDLDGKQAYFDIDAPRFSLAPAETAGVFPPKNGHGPFDEIIPHIALGRRTLPWERPFSAAKKDFNGVPIPWLALIMFEDGECTVEVRRKIGDRLPAAVVLRLGVPADLLVDTVTAESELIKDLLPSHEELTLLAHVRQVNIDDRELGAGDSNGFFAVVMGSRIPRRGRKYRCCLVSIEERNDLVPAEPPPFAADTYVSFVPVGRTQTVVVTNENDFVWPPGTRFGTSFKDVVAGAGVDVATDARSAASFSIAGTAIGPLDRAADSPSAWRPLIPQDSLVVLTTWTFECEGTASFRALMQALDVGMIGKPHDGGPTLTDTGHLQLDMIDRAGAPASVFYRGPMVPTPLSRDANGPYHCADQARRAAPEVGAENVSYACAFEVGRLLAAADGRLAQELMRWRRGAYIRALRDDSERFIERWAGIAAFDPLWPIALPFAMSVIERLVAGAAPVLDPFELAKLGGAPGLDPALIEQTFGLASRDEALALLGVGDGLLAASIGVAAGAALPEETLSDVLNDVDGLARLTGARDRIIDNTWRRFGKFGGVGP